MRSKAVIVESPTFAVAAVRCTDDHPAWSAPEESRDHRVVLVRAGRFRLRSDGRRVPVDPTVGYVQAPGDELRFAHPAGGDLCTAISMTAGLWHDMTGDRSRPPALHIDARLDLAHRRLLRSAPDTSFELAERVLALLGTALGQVTGTTPGGSASTALAADAREALAAGHPAAGTLLSLAGLLGVSPYHLSRVFRRETGTTLTRYRNRIRVGRALDRIEQGERDLASLAADLGFADHAHLTRTIKAETGSPPAQLRRLLTPPIRRS